METAQLWKKGRKWGNWILSETPFWRETHVITCTVNETMFLDQLKALAEFSQEIQGRHAKAVLMLAR